MKKWLHNMTAHGGGDCPEMALTGIVNGKIPSLSSLVFCLYMYQSDWHYHKDIHYLNV